MLAFKAVEGAKVPFDGLCLWQLPPVCGRIVEDSVPSIPQWFHSRVWSVID